MSEFETTAEFDVEELQEDIQPLEAVPRLSFGAKTDIGRIRENNEDKFEFYLPKKDVQLATRGAAFVVCDGMGGAEAGQIAAELSCKTFLDVYYNHRAARAADAALAAVKAANRFVNDVGTTVPSRRGMGCTLSAVMFVQREVVLAHVGDSRIYRVRAGEIEQISEEHSYVEEQVRLGAMSPQEAEDSPYKHILSRAIGADKDVIPQIETFALNTGDVYLLCSDGVSNEVPDSVMLDTLTSCGASEAAWRLVNDALLAGGRDNATAIVVSVDSIDAAE